MGRKLKKGKAVLSAWSLITAMGLTPVLSVAYPSAAAVVYAREADSTEENGDTDAVQKGKKMLSLATPSNATPSDLSRPVGGIFYASPETLATPSNAAYLLRSNSLWGGIEMSDHLDGEGTEEEPYEINSDKDLKLLAYNVANEEVDGYEGCYFILTRDISLSSTASWLPIGYFAEAEDSEPMPFKGHFDGQGYRIYNLKISDTTQDYAGLFGSLHGATIENLTVDGQVNANSKAGLLAGEINDSEIRNCCCEGQVRGVGAIGGIVG